MSDSTQSRESIETAPSKEAQLGSHTESGAPASSDRNSLTVGPDGPILLHDHYLIEQMAHFNRERIPERQPHAKGGGAFGTFEITEDVSRRTPRPRCSSRAPTPRCSIRFSTVAGERGSPDTWRDPRGFALKFYTTEGNYDLVGNNTPVFFIRDPHEVPALHPLARSAAPDTDLRDARHAVGLLDPVPESAHQVTWLMGDRGMPGHLART